MSAAPRSRTTRERLRHDVTVRTPNDLPILEYDDDPDDPISRAFRSRARVRLPERAVLTLVGRHTPEWAAAHGFEKVAVWDTVTRDFPIWTGSHGDIPVTLVEIPLGAPAATMLFDYLILLGVRTAVAVGSCGALVHLEEGRFVLPARALRADGTSYHYQPAQRWVATDDEVRAACATACADAGVGYVEADTWTTDAFFRETSATIEARRRDGCQVVDMECSALAACARFRGVRFAQVLFTGDTLAGDEHDMRRLGKDARQAGLRLALDAVARVSAAAER